MDITSSFTALLVEDSMSLGALYTEYLRTEGARVTHVNHGSDALNELKRWQPDLLVLDIQLPDMSGMDILERVQQDYPDITVIMITAHGSIDLAVDAMRSGAFDFLVKPFDAKRLSITVRNALKQRQLVNLVAKYESSLPKPHYMGFIGESLAMQTVYKTIDCVASSKASAFIIGESGTGKEVCAHAIHNAGNRSDGPFVALNCASIPKDLIESEIFGHTKGAFTGAIANRDGAATQAHNGTLFLDEICEMDLELQSKLLRFIQTGVFQRVGATKEEKVDVRFVSATNRMPWDEVKAGRFREDLFYRLHVIPIELPPLRMRGKDILLLASSLLKEYNKEEGKKFKGFSPEAKQCLKSYQWPGNVRQLQNVIRQIVVLNDCELVELDMLPVQLTAASNSDGKAIEAELTTPSFLDEIEQVTFAKEQQYAPEAAADTLNENRDAKNDEIVPLWKTEKQTIENAIARCDGNVPKAAALLDISASTIYRKRQTWDELENSLSH
ncbi:MULTISPECIES: sigma-54 dependent transcriptional regulator [unclassified Shewanella]|uniref:sigma-54-dependent transcriptional regulator n=1 Tax=unclassified Shewanella TaxID=196818 RepID=UPI001BB993E5|nr:MULTISPECIES: sigma-54 dependent transcriptional regulator [unclassified Shewanella]GIU18171.1 sigma-54-dependent Fis family transcriptional regulator [Shewanella sp. MBTL60-112-B1]GIU38980.1 sigma-54-dependent Fis family transcriptional regulator [Shewanella sp. MBTL60-112-B2]